jgi:hypothetical protein
VFGAESVESFGEMLAEEPGPPVAQSAPDAAMMLSEGVVLRGGP